MPTQDALYPFIAQTGDALGSDIGGVRRMDYALTTVKGRLALAQAILRRLTTRRGGLFYAPTYGYNLLDLIGSAVPAGVVEQRVLEQVLYEEEVTDASCAATMIGETLKVVLAVVDGQGPFELTLTVTQLDLQALLNGSPMFSVEAP